MYKHSYEFNEFYCTQCGAQGIPIVRTGQKRKAGHLKKLFCLECGYETNHVECKENTKYTYKDFVTEFEYGNFTPLGQRKYSYSKLKELIRDGKLEKTQTLANCGNPRSGQKHLGSES